MNTVPRWLMVVFVVVFVALATAGGWFFRSQERRVRADVEADLGAIARLKVDQIAQWRAERLGDATVLMESPFTMEAVTRWLSDPQAETAAPLLTLFRALQRNYHYGDVLLVDAPGQVRLSASGRTGKIHEEAARSVATAFQQHQAFLSDLHAGPGDLPPHLEVVAPFFAHTGETVEPIGAILLQVNAHGFLDPIVQSWPRPSRTAETLLVRRNGDALVFLTESRHHQGPALDLRIPLSSEQVPAVRAALDQGGVVEGRDYGGVQVLSVYKAIPDSSWLMVAKIDKTEALAGWRFRSTLILVLVLGFLAAATTAAGMICQSYGKAQYRALFRSEAALRESEEVSYRTTLMSIGDAVIVTDAQGRVRLLNSVAEALTGWQQEEAQGRSAAEVFHIVNEESRQPVEDPVARVLREGVLIGLANHTLLISRDDTEFPIADSAAPIVEETGTVTGVVLVFRDQTRERQTEIALQTLAARQQALLEAIPDIIMEVDENKVYTWSNQAGLDFYGEDVIGKEASEFFVGEQDTYTSVAPLFAGQESVLRVESWQRRKDGQTRLLSWRCRAIKDRSGSVTGVLSSARDITEIRRAEEKRLKSEERYGLLVRNIPGVVYRGFADGSVEFFDDKIQSILGHPIADFASRKLKWTELIHPEDLAPSKAIFLQALRGDHGYIREYRVRRRDGGYVWVQERSQIVCREDRRIDHITGILFDVTERKQGEAEKEKLEAQFRQAQKMEAVGRLAGGVAHDFNNMLGVILGYAELALTGLKPIDPLHRYLKAVQGAASRSADLVRQLLAFSRKQTIAPRPLNLNEQTKGMERLLGRIIGEDIDLMFNLTEKLWPVYMDPAQTDQILANLAVNSRDAMPQGGKLTVETANLTLDEDYCERHLGFKPGNFVMLAVSDTGCGMSKEVIEHAFEPFFTTKPEGQGTGLGLATVYGIVKQNNGFVNIYSEPGQGTTVKIYIPCYVGPDDTAAPVAIETGRPIGGAETILLVEDEDEMRQLAKTMLQQLGYRVLEAPGPGEAIASCEKYPDQIHLLFTDVVMPNLSGKELEGRIMAMKPGIKTLFMSGYTANAIAHRGVLEKGAHFLQKPFSLETLARKLREVLGS